MLEFMFFFFNDTATTEIYTLSLHDALPIWSTDSRNPDAMKPVGSAQPRRTQRSQYIRQQGGRPPVGLGAIRRYEPQARFMNSHAGGCHGVLVRSECGTDHMKTLKMLE